MANFNGQFIRLTSLSFQELKERFSQAPSIHDCGLCDTYFGTLPKCFFVEEIGVMAITENSDEAIDFLIEALSHTDKFVRFNAYGHLGGTISGNREKIISAIENNIRKEKSQRVLEIAIKSLAKIKGI